MDLFANLTPDNLRFSRRDPRGYHPNPNDLIPKQTPPDFTVLRQLVGKSIISSRQFSKELVGEICRFSALLESTEIASSHPLDGKIIITGFFEPSTRTRLSFESAVLRLDGKILSVPDGKETGIAKGESLADIGEMFNAYSDLVIVRHKRTESINELFQSLRIPLINAGNGSGEHPTQALSDWYALLKWRPGLAAESVPAREKIHMGIIGTPASMRAVRSFLLMALLFKDAISHLTIISEMADPLGTELWNDLKEAGVPFTITNDIETVISDLDVFYMNSIALLGDGYRFLDSRYKLHAGSRLKEGAIILHPLARGDELCTSLDESNHNLYFSQASGAVYVRQALLISVLDRFDRLPKKLTLQTN